MSAPNMPSEHDPPNDDGLRRLLKIIDQELDEERRSRDADSSAQEKLDTRLRDLEAATRSVEDEGQ
jgi:hypothetical protein